MHITGKFISDLGSISCYFLIIPISSWEVGLRKDYAKKFNFFA